MNHANMYVSWTQKEETTTTVICHCHYLINNKKRRFPFSKIRCTLKDDLIFSEYTKSSRAIQDVMFPKLDNVLVSIDHDKLSLTVVFCGLSFSRESAQNERSETSERIKLEISK